MNKVLDRSVRLSLNESKYWKRFFTNNLKIGVELECCYPRSTSEPVPKLRSSLLPTNSYGEFGAYGVTSVKSDGSLTNGAEICTIGRRLDYLDLYYQYKYICDKMIALNANMNSRAGLHNHVLLDFGNGWNCLEKPVPGIILKNLIQLTRMYCPEMVWITSTVCQDDEGDYEQGHNGDWITRKKYFCDQRSLLNTNVNEHNTKNLVRTITNDNNDRYTFMNLLNMEFTQNRNELIKVFHFEYRFPDGSMYPAQIAAQNMLYAAMVIKAIKLSETGIVDCGDNFTQTKSLMNTIRTDESGLRCSRSINEGTMNILRARSLDMITYLKPELDAFDIHIYPILKVLAAQPISLMRREMNDVQVNASFQNLVDSMYGENINDCETLLEYITLQNSTGARNENDWSQVACTDLSMSKEEFNSKMTKINRNVTVKFDKTIGSYIIV